MMYIYIVSVEINTQRNARSCVSARVALPNNNY